MEKVGEFFTTIGEFIASLDNWIKIAASSVIVLTALIITMIILKKRKARRIEAEKRRRMEELNKAISNKRKGA